MYPPSTTSPANPKTLTFYLISSSQAQVFPTCDTAFPKILTGEIDFIILKHSEDCREIVVDYEVRPGESCPKLYKHLHLKVGGSKYIICNVWKEGREM